MIRTIYLDLDDVLNTLAPYALNAVGCPIGPSDYSGYPTEFDYAAHEVANNMLHTAHTWNSFWLNFSQHFWATAPKSDLCDWLIETCRSLVGEKNVFIATMPVDDPRCIVGKMEWIQEHCPSWLHQQFFITPHKHFLARPDTLLIDDHLKNIRQFRARGGQAILVPRPWNPLEGYDPKTHITEGFQSHFGRIVND